MCKGLISTTALILLHAQPEMKNEIKTAGNGCPEKITITIKKKSKHKIQIQKQQNIANNTKRQKRNVVKKFQVLFQIQFQSYSQEKMPRD